MDVKLSHISEIKNQFIQITGSKSETNRLMILKMLYPNIQIQNISNSDDSNVMEKALRKDQDIVDVHHAGTAMRFLTAYFSVQKDKNTLLTGSQRMQQRPIKILVDALRQLGCQIRYQKEEGYPPIEITGVAPVVNKVSLPADISSQYISALMLIASSLPEGLEIHLEGKITSLPYIEMTLSLLKDVGVEGVFDGNVITISSLKNVDVRTIEVESDWSSASYYYSIIALSNKGSVTLGSYKQQSYQGDAILASIYSKLGVETVYDCNTVRLTKIASHENVKLLELDLSNAPDIAQTITVTCFGLGIACYLTGLHTLKIKETDRLEALKKEVEKLGGQIEITQDTLKLAPSSGITSEVAIDTYQDHRMAMSFAPLALRTSLTINQADVVSKSYPDFWKDLKKIGFITSGY